LSFLLVLVVLQVYILWNKYACGQPALVGDLVLTVAFVAVDPAVLYKALEGIDDLAKRHAHLAVLAFLYQKRLGHSPGSNRLHAWFCFVWH